MRVVGIVNQGMFPFFSPMDTRDDGILSTDLFVPKRGKIRRLGGEVTTCRPGTREPSVCSLRTASLFFSATKNGVSVSASPRIRVVCSARKLHGLARHRSSRLFKVERLAAIASSGLCRALRTAHPTQGRQRRCARPMMALLYM